MHTNGLPARRGPPILRPMSHTHRLYDDLAVWWPLLSPPDDYGEEADDLVPRLGALPAAATLLELGCGGGSLAFHLKNRFRLTLSDRSPGMLAHSRRINPECEHVEGDMRTLRLGREFDVVLIHDAIMYATTRADLAASLHTAALHCRRGGVVAVLPDCTRETFRPGTDHGGHDGADGRALRYLEWTWDPDPADDTFVADYAFALREADGTVSVVHDRHVEGLFSRADWLALLSAEGITATLAVDPWEREIFVGRRNGPTEP